MAATIGINHVTVATRSVDAMVDFYVGMFGGTAVFDSSGRTGHPRMVIVEIGSGRYVKIVDDRARTAEPSPGVERFGLAVDSEVALRDLRDHLTALGATVGDIQRLPTQWVLTITDPDGGLIQACAHAR
ncbi:VOC family protein [Millisia brevis]|uniref:VOC family protein n=1 Tax=Millisia brevis TaxID=264148 RepID=UPI0008377CA3|nr:VOC family protein [Millisia brevis]